MSVWQCCPAQSWTLIDALASSVACQWGICTQPDAAKTDGPYGLLPTMLSPLSPLQVS